MAKKEKPEKEPVKIPRGQRSTMCIHRVPPTAYCSRCGS